MELAIYFHRDEVAAPETISGTAATNAIVGTNTTFTTDCYVGQKLYVPDVGALEIASIADDTHLTVEALASDFTNAKPFYSWTRYYVELSEIAKQVESDNPGEAGAVVLDSVTATFRNHATDAAPVHSAFSLSELNGDRRYLFAIFAVKPGEPPKRVFTGMADFASVERSPFYVAPDSTEIVPTVTFEIVDLFAALNLVQSKRYKTLGRLVDNSSYTGAYRYPDNPSDARIPLFIKHSSSRFVTMRIVDYSGGSFTPQTLAESNTPQVGDVLPWVFATDHDAADVEYIEDDAGDDFAISPSGYAFLIVQKRRSSGGDYVCFDAISNSGSFYDDHTNSLLIDPPLAPPYLADTDALVGSDTIVAYQKIGYYDELFGGVDIFVRETTETTFPVPTLDTPDNWTGDYSYDDRAYGVASETATSERIVAIDGIAAMKAIVAQVWPDLEFALRLKRWDSGTSSYVAMTEYRLPTDYVFRLLDSYPFGKEPLEAVQFIASAIRAYLYIDGTGKAILVNEAHLLDATPTALSLADALSLRRRDFWDKLCDVAKVYVRSWMRDPDDPEPYAYLDGAGAAWRSDAANTKPRNPIEKELIVDEPSLSEYGYEIDGGTLVDSSNPLLPAEQALNSYAEEKAAEYLAFYGKAHEAIEATFGLTWAMLEWELTGVFSYSTSDYFATRLTLDLMRDTLDVELVGLSGRTYHSESVRVGKKEDGYLTPTSSGAEVLIGSSAASGSTSASLGWDGRATHLDASRGRGSLGLGA
ncbi:MAG: hypothetical protein GF419_14480, partial [Ignavibacteriales bacterium]|nr:hypothetical protein [Ignavibacteriales bacterium]